VQTHCATCIAHDVVEVELDRPPSALLTATLNAIISEVDTRSNFAIRADFVWLWKRHGTDVPCRDRDGAVIFHTHTKSTLRGNVRNVASCFRTSIVVCLMCSLGGEIRHVHIQPLVLGRYSPDPSTTSRSQISPKRSMSPTTPKTPLGSLDPELYTFEVNV
jgi:hypothetical protein